MKHYPHHISDFNNATRHLTREERSLYRDLIELYYETEKPLPADVPQICRRILANELSTDVERMLNEFFIKTPVGWYHARCDEEIAKYQGNNSQRALAGKASAAKKAQKSQQALNGNSTGVEIPLNEKPTEIHNQSTNQPINQSTKGEDAQAPDRPSMTGAVCMAMKAEGMAAVNPSHPELQVLIDKGADIGLFASVARECVEKKKPFAYALAMVAGRMSDAAKLADTALSMPNKNTPTSLSFQERDELARRKRWEEMTGEKWPDESRKIQPLETVIDISEINKNIRRIA